VREVDRCRTHARVDLGPEGGGQFWPVCETVLRKADPLNSVKVTSSAMDTADASARFLCLACTNKIAPEQKMDKDTIQKNAGLYMGELKAARDARRNKAAERDRAEAGGVAAAKFAGTAMFETLRDAWAAAKATKGGSAQFQEAPNLGAFAAAFPPRARAFMEGFTGAAKEVLLSAAQRKVRARARACASADALVTLADAGTETRPNAGTPDVVAPKKGRHPASGYRKTACVSTGGYQQGVGGV